MLFLFAKAQMYVGLGFGGELDRRPLKALKINGEARPDFIREQEGLGNFLRDYNAKDWGHKYLGALKLGTNIGLKCGWSAMLEVAAHLHNIAGMSVNAKALIRHRIGLFAGVGAEYGYMWSLTHAVKQRGGEIVALPEERAAEGPVDKLKALTESEIIKKDNKNLGCNEFYGLATVGTHTELGRGFALQVEGQVLLGFQKEQTVSDVTFERKSSAAPQMDAKHELTYGWPFKLRLLASIVKFI